MDASVPSLPRGYRLLTLPRTDSTNEEAKRQAAAGAAGGLVIVADAQTAGRGRRGRTWHSPPGNLYLSLLLRPDYGTGEAPLAGFAVSLAVADFISGAAARQEVRCKWPNDVLVADKKVAGILVETAARSDGNLDWLIIGVGVNLASHPPDTDRPATSLSAMGIPMAPRAATARLVELLDRRLSHWRDHGFEPTRRAWLNRAWRLGETVEFSTGGESITGRFEGLDAQGGLVLSLPTGESRTHGHGELLVAG